jgi:multisubunit Na+/H+ antiporter MnhE subunit
MQIRHKLAGFLVAKICKTIIRKTRDTHACIWLIPTSLYLVILSLTIHTANLKPKFMVLNEQITPVLLLIRCRVFPKHQITCLQSLAVDK